MSELSPFVPRRLRAGVRFGLILLVIGLCVAAPAFGHGVGHSVERAEAVIVRFSSHHEPAIVDAGFRVFAPDGRSLFAEGRTDALGRAVFVPDAPGPWRMVMATADGHGAEVEIEVDESGLAALSDVPVHLASSGRLSATAAGVGYVLGLAGLLALWRRREAG